MSAKKTTSTSNAHVVKHSESADPLSAAWRKRSDENNEVINNHYNIIRKEKLVNGRSRKQGKDEKEAKISEVTLSRMLKTILKAMTQT